MEEAANDAVNDAIEDDFGILQDIQSLRTSIGLEKSFWMLA